ncbi:MAG TPA: Wzz/FepE/Etk N-terminal domain-containing protein, partial [Ktedonobacteraceae bacterium]|nr:Wzz/FepE/Etk N-terminal domain-containing protein [Ktedonobacteraceae bacterium]
MTFEHFVRILLKRWGLVVICCLLVGLGAFIGSKFMKPLYQSTAVMEVVIRSGGDPLTNDNILASQQLAQAEADLVTTDSVLGEVASRNPGLSVDDLAAEVTATPIASTQIFEIHVLDPDPVRAAILANSLATVLIQQQAQVAQQNPAQAGFLVMAQSARPASSPARPNTLFNTAAGLLAGFILGILLALMFELLDTRVRTDEDLTQLLDWSVLTALRKTGRDEEVVNRAGYNSNTGPYSTLKTNIGFAMA